MTDINFIEGDLEEVVDLALKHAEDGLDPGDALTPEEALARVLWILRSGRTVADGYADNAIIGGPPITCLLRWERDHDEERAGWRDRFERAGLVSTWNR